MIIAAVLVVCIGAGLVTMYIINKNKSEKLRDEYLDNIREFTSLSYRAEKNLEDISDTTVRYWYENIYEDKHGSSINTAIAYALAAKKSELADAKKYDEDLRALYTEIKRVPDGVPKDDEDELEELCDTAKDVYNTYTAFYSHATDPTGSYNSYSSDNYEKKDEFLTQYLKLLNSTD